MPRTRPRRGDTGLHYFEGLPDDQLLACQRRYGWKFRPIVGRCDVRTRGDPELNDSRGLYCFRNTATAVAAGTCSITGTQAGNANYNSASSSLNFTVASAPPVQSGQTISFAPISNVPVGSSPISLSATASSGLPVTFSGGAAGVCSVSGNSVSIIGTGTCSVTASQIGNQSFTAAPAVTQSFQVTGQIKITTSSLPSGTVNQPYAAVSLGSSGGTGTLTWSVVSGALPGGISLSGSGSVGGTPTAAGGFSFSVQVVDSTGATAIQGFSIQVSPALTITSSSLPAAVLGVAYNQALTASGGTGNYSWSVSGGTLPGGVGLSASGALSGTPTASGSFSFTAQVSDGVSTATQSISLTVGATLTITSSGTLVNGITGQAYTAGFAANGGTGGPYKWSVASGALPSGLGLSSGGTLAGNPSVAGTFNFSVQVTDGSSPPATLAASLTVFNSVTITTTSLPDGIVGVAYGPATLAAKGGSGSPITWAASGLPAGISLSAAGAFGGTPTALASGSITVTATDTGSGQVVTAGIPLAVAAATTSLKISPSTLVVGAGVGGSLSGAFKATGGTAPYTFSASGLPSGVNIAPDGTVSGSSSAAGNTSVTVTVTDSAAAQSTASAQLSVQVLGLTTGAVPAGAATVLYTASFAATGGKAPYVFSATGLPAGLGMSGSGGISGTPPTQGTFPFTVQVSDSSGLTTSKGYSLFIDKAPVSVTSSSLSSGAVGSPYSQTLTASGGNAPYTWSLLTGVTPTGLSVDGSGTVSGIPTIPGSGSFGVQVTDASGGVASGAISITVSPSSISSTIGAFPSGVVNFSYPTQVLSATGGVAPYAYSLTEGGLPPGLTLGGGTVSGTPTAVGSFPFTITVTDSAGHTTPSGTSIVIRPATPGLVVLAGSVSFSLATGTAGLPPGQTVGVQSAIVSQTLNYSTSVAPSAPWLSVGSGGSTPGTLSIALTSAALSLPAGNNSATVTLTCTSSACQNSTQTIAVSLTVTSPPPQLGASSGLLSFSSSTTPPQAQSLPLLIQNIGGGTLTVNSVSCESAWCKAGSYPSSLKPGPATEVTITADPTTLASGFYRTSVDISTSAGSASVPVTFFISQSASMNLSPAGTQFSMPVGSSPGNSSGSFLVSVSGNSVTWTASVQPGADWLTLGTSAGTSSSAQPGTVSYSINSSAANLPAGAYYGTIRVAGPGIANSPQDFQVVLNVTPVTQPSVPDPQPAGLVFITTAGSNVPPQQVNIYSSSATPTAYQAAASATWLSVSPTVGSASAASPGHATVFVDTSSLNQGTYYGGVSYAFGGAGIRTVNVTVIVQAVGGSAVVPLLAGAAPRATCSPTALIATQTALVNSFSAPASWPTPLSLTVNDDCGNPVSTGQVVATFSNGDAPLAFSVANASSGLYSATWTPRSSASQVIINAKATKSGLTPATAQLAGAVVPNETPTIDPNGVVHPFDPQIGGALSPGTIVAIYGSHLASVQAQPTSIPLPTKLNGTTVLIGGRPSPLFYVSPGQINVQIPFELDPAEKYQVIVNANGALTTPQSIQLTAVNPGLDTFPDGTLVAVHAADATLISAASPAQPGEYIVMFLLGMGATDNPVTSGDSSSGTVLSQPTALPTLTLNNNPVPIAFAGLTPGLVGLYQINLQIPPDTPGGNLVLSVSQDGVAGNSAILPIAF